MSDVMAVSATRAQIRERADGSLEVKVVIDPRFIRDFHRLFPELNQPIALAPLVKDFERRPSAPEPKPSYTNSRWVALRCKEPSFQAFMHASNEEDCAQAVRVYCAVDSRSQLDTDPAAEEQFHELRRNYSKYLQLHQLPV